MLPFPAIDQKSHHRGAVRGKSSSTTNFFYSSWILEKTKQFYGDISGDLGEARFCNLLGGRQDDVARDPLTMEESPRIRLGVGWWGWYGVPIYEIAWRVQSHRRSSKGCNHFGLLIGLRVSVLIEIIIFGCFFAWNLQVIWLICWLTFWTGYFLY